MKTITMSILACASVINAAPAFAQAEQAKDPFLARLTQGFKDVTSFPTNTSMTGYAAVDPKSGKRITMYYDPASHVVIYGIGFDLATSKQLGPPVALLGKALPAPTAAPVPQVQGAEKQKVIKAVMSMSYVEIKGVRADGSVLYAVVEPGCGYCQASYRDLMPLLADSRSPLSALTIRWVPVSLRPANFTQVAAALDPAGGSALERAQAIFVAPAKRGAAESATRLATANLGAFQTVNFEGTPTFVLRANGVDKVMVGYSGVEEVKSWVE